MTLPPRPDPRRAVRLALQPRAFGRYLSQACGAACEALDKPYSPPMFRRRPRVRRCARRSAAAAEGQISPQAWRRGRSKHPRSHHPDSPPRFDAADSKIAHQAVGMVRSWWRPARPPEEVERLSDRIARLAMQGLQILARQGVQDKELRSAVAKSLDAALQPHRPGDCDTDLGLDPVRSSRPPARTSSPRLNETTQRNQRAGHGLYWSSSFDDDQSGCKCRRPDVGCRRNRRFRTCAGGRRLESRIPTGSSPAVGRCLG